MKLKEFIEEEKKRIELFEAYWLANMAQGAKSGEGDPIWPEDMESGQWDEALMMFDSHDGVEFLKSLEDDTPEPE